MRLKQQSFVDKYIEKVILVVAVLVALCIIYFYVLGTPYSVVTAPGKTATPAEVEKAYLEQGNVLKKAITENKAPKELVDLEVPDYVSRFKARYEQHLIKSGSFYPIVFGEPGITGVGGGGTPDPVRDVLVVKPPAAKGVTAKPDYHVLETDEAIVTALTDIARAQYPDAKDDAIKALVADWHKKALAAAGQREPRDFWGVTVSATISLQDWLDAIAKVADEKRMPESWYADMAQFISGIEVHRQVMDPKTGQWGEPTVVPTLPGAVSDILRAYVKQVQDAKTAKIDSDETADLQVALVENLRFYQEDLVKPQFLPVKAQRPWTQPDQVPLELDPADQQALLKINQQITKYESELRALMGRSGAGGAEAGKTGTVPPRIERGYEEGFLPPAPGRTPPRTAPKTKQPAPGVDPAKKAVNPNEERIKLYQTRLEDLYKQRDAILIKLIKDKPADGSAVDPSAPVRPDPRRPRGEAGEFINPEFIRPGTVRPGGFRPGYPGDATDPAFDGKLQPIKLWAHDVNLMPGMTYRYRIVYRVINPLFNKEDRLVQGQKQLAADLEQPSVESEWSEPVTIEPPVRFFVEDVKPETATVTWGVYRIYNGYRIHKQFTTRPGDPIGKTVEVDVKDDAGAAAGKEMIDLGVNRLLLDLKTPPKQAGVIGVRGPMTVLVADLASGQVATRDPASDREDPDRIRLFNEATGALNAPAAPVGGAGERIGEFPGLRPPTTVAPPEGGIR